jgi:hypothetical protein
VSSKSKSLSERYYHYLQRYRNTQASRGWTYLQCCEPEPLSEFEWIARIGKAVGWSGDIIDGCVPEHLKTDLDWRCHLIADTSRIRSELGNAEGLSQEQRFEKRVTWESVNPPAEVNPALFDYEAEDRCLDRIRGVESTGSASLV